MLKVLAHADLPHELVLVTVHARQLADMRKDILQPVGQLEGVHVVQPVLHVRVHHKFRQAENFPAKMEGIPEAGLFPFLGGEGFHGFQVEVVVEMEVVEVLAVNQEVQHIVALTAHLQTGFHPVQRRRLHKKWSRKISVNTKNLLFVSFSSSFSHTKHIFVYKQSVLSRIHYT